MSELFKNATASSTSEQAYLLARRRIDVGNPPGKNGSLGDALNWEVLLECAPEGEELWFVTEDGDYASALDPNAFHSFLSHEWQERKKSRVRFCRRLSEFFRAKYPHITLASGVEKDMAIQELASSGSFLATHAAIAKLEQFSDFTPGQMNAIAAAATTNDQVYRIIEDPDLKQLLDRLVRDYGASMDPPKREALLAKLGATKSGAG